MPTSKKYIIVRNYKVSMRIVYESLATMEGVHHLIFHPVAHRQIAGLAPMISIKPKDIMVDEFYQKFPTEADDTIKHDGLILSAEECWQIDQFIKYFNDLSFNDYRAIIYRAKGLHHGHA